MLIGPYDLRLSTYWQRQGVYDGKYPVSDGDTASAALHLTLTLTLTLYNPNPSPSPHLSPNLSLTVLLALAYVRWRCCHRYCRRVNVHINVCAPHASTNCRPKPVGGVSIRAIYGYLWLSMAMAVDMVRVGVRPSVTISWGALKKGCGDA